MRQPLLDAVRGLDPAAAGPEIDGEAMLARIREEVHSPERSDVAHLLPAPQSRPARRIAMGAAALAFVTVVALALTLMRGPEAYASWVASPTLVPAAEAAADCPDTEIGPPEIPLEPVLAERRGSYTFVVLTGDGVFVECLVSTARNNLFVVTQGTEPPSDADLDLGVAPALVLNPGSVWFEEGREGPVTTVLGLAAADVTEIRVSTTEGVTAEAAIADGWWSVWFPGEVEIADTLVIVTAEGESTLSVEGLIAPGLR